MVTVEQMQREIAKLPPDDFRRLAQWIAEHDSEEWDKAIEEDATTGKLDRLYAKLQSENKGTETIALNDFLDNERLP
jgi:hypothetical protein